MSGGVLGRGIGSGSECESGCVLLGGRKCCNGGINDLNIILSNVCDYLIENNFNIQPPNRFCFYVHQDP